MKLCFVGLDNLPVLAPEFRQHTIGGESVQQTLLAKALAIRGHDVSMVVRTMGRAIACGASRFECSKPTVRRRGCPSFVLCIRAGLACGRPLAGPMRTSITRAAPVLKSD